MISTAAWIQGLMLESAVDVVLSAKGAKCNTQGNALGWINKLSSAESAK
jgi:hypothetical protein